MPVWGTGAAVERIILLPDDDYTGDQSVEVGNPGWDRIAFWVTVTAAPGVFTLAGAVRTRVPSVGGTLVLMEDTAGGTGTGVRTVLVGPGVVNSWQGGINALRGTVLPQLLLFDVDINGGTWTFEAGVDVHWK